MLSHHLQNDNPKRARRTTTGERWAIGSILGVGALIAVFALQSGSTTSEQDLAASDLAPHSVSISI